LELSTASAGPTGTITSGALETSNVDIAEELTDLIQIQRAYSSNAKVVTTADEILDETMRIKR
jgi:flagellar hook protein FlgE